MPLTKKGKKIMKAMKKQYGKEKGEQVFYASANKGKIKDVHENLTQEDIDKYATEEEKNILERKSKKEKLAPGWTPEDMDMLKFALKMQKKRRDDAERRKNLDALMKIKKEDIDKYATEEEKEFLKEDYSDLINPSGHSKCPKCGSDPEVGSQSYGKVGRRHYYIKCSNPKCYMTSDGVYEDPLYRNLTKEETQKKAIDKAWEKWDTGNIFGYGFK